MLTAKAPRQFLAQAGGWAVATEPDEPNFVDEGFSVLESLAAVGQVHVERVVLRKDEREIALTRIAPAKGGIHAFDLCRRNKGRRCLDHGVGNLIAGQIAQKSNLNQFIAGQLRQKIKEFIIAF